MLFLSTFSALSLLYAYVSLFDRLPLCVSAVNTVLTNDDGWAVANIRAFNAALLASGFNVVLSAPAENESGTGSSDAPATTVGSSGCEFDSCPAGSPPEGNNASDTRLNYVNSFPVTAVRFGIQTLAPEFFGGPPEIVVSGPNVGTNLGTGTQGSGTVGAATEAAKEGIPAIAFSGSTGSQVSFTTLSSSSSSTTAAEVYASLAVSLTNNLLSSTTKPILPPNINLNVNFPSISSRCVSSSDFNFVFTRINTATSSTPPDVETCGTDRLPTETSVVEGSGCFASVSVMNATSKDDVDASTQEFVLERLSGFFVCS